MTSVPLNILINDDTIFENNETFTLTINNSSLPSCLVTVGDAVEVTVIIVDNDSKYVRN